MAYSIPRNVDCEEMYKYISKTVRWKRVWGDIVPTLFQKGLIKECLDSIVKIDELSISRLANLLFYVTEEELRIYWKNECDIQSGVVKRGKGSSNVDVLTGLYGRKQAEVIANESKQRSSNNFRKENIINRYIKHGYSKEEAELKFIEEQRRKSNKRWDRLRTEGVDLSEYTKRINPICKEYVGYVGMSEDEVETERKIYLDRCRRDNQYYIDNYGEELAAKLLEERRTKRLNTMLDNGTGIFSTDKGTASKWSQKLFLPLVEWLKELGYNNEDIQMGLPEFRGERWIRYDKSKYFLYDFCFLPTNVIIEYHGTRWHPLEDGSWYDDCHMSVCPIKERERDLYKKTLAENNGYKVLEIWSHEDIDDAIERCKEFIRLTGVNEVQDERRAVDISQFFC